MIRLICKIVLGKSDISALISTEFDIYKTCLTKGYSHTVTQLLGKGKLCGKLYYDV